MSTLGQIYSVTYFSLISLRRRIGSSLVIVIGIAGVVAVLISVLAMSSGMIKTAKYSGREDRAIVLRNGSASEIGSVLLPAIVREVKDAPGVKRIGGHQPAASDELLRLVGLKKKVDDSEVSAVIRGVGKNWPVVRPEITLVEGRKFQPALHEVIVGKAAQRTFKGLDIGSEIEARNATWTVVGIFSSGGDSRESELLTDASTLASASGEISYRSSVTVLLDSSSEFRAFKNALTKNPSVSVDVMRESDYYTRQSKTMSRLVSWVAYAVGGIMALGAFFGAMNAMYSAVNARTRQIATLRALGFESPATIVAVLAESMLLSAAGGIVGAAIACIFFNGHTVSTGSGTQGSIVFDIVVSPVLIVTGIFLACAIGLLGGMFPAIRAARLPISVALRSV